jgi:phosphoglycolate phosphatase-like HAD superfamily hydrolase
MVGDTTFDMEMARAAGVTATGVGYHPRERLRRARQRPPKALRRSRGRGTIREG